MKPYSIYDAKYSWSNCDDARPWLMISEPLGTLIEAFPISGQCYGDNCFFIDSTRAEFGATGLSKRSFIHYGSIIMLPIEAVGRHRGTLIGPMLAEFIAVSGL